MVSDQIFHLLTHVYGSGEALAFSEYRKAIAQIGDIVLVWAVCCLNGSVSLLLLNNLDCTKREWYLP